MARGTDRKVKAEGLKIIFIDIRHLPNVIIGGTKRAITQQNNFFQKT